MAKSDATLKQHIHTIQGFKKTTSMIRENLRKMETVERASSGTERYRT